MTEVRVERLQDISEADAVAEGVKPDVFDGPDGWEECTRTDHIGAYRRLWNDLNAKRGFGWDANPWVVAVSFEVVKANIDRMTASPPSPLQDDAGASVPVIKDECPPDNAGAPAPRSAFDRDGEVSRG